MSNIRKWNEIFRLIGISPQCIMSSITRDSVGREIYPRNVDVLKAFDLCGPDDVRVIIIGQDCYHGPGQATGLCFAVPDGVAVPPSLMNIIKELRTDTGLTPRFNLESWAKQGILLLNSSLTVEKGRPGSHMSYWVKFTDEIIRYLNDNYSGLIFCLWGNFAKAKASIIDQHSHTILESAHPSPLSANRGGWFGTKHFSQINNILDVLNEPPIIWGARLT
tara:strand:- start:189 stop:848 length:660 start_codon:yes stop_codon:yes gene_type:complete